MNTNTLFEITKEQSECTKAYLKKIGNELNDFVTSELDRKGIVYVSDIPKTILEALGLHKTNYCGWTRN